MKKLEIIENINKNIKELEKEMEEKKIIGASLFDDYKKAVVPMVDIVKEKYDSNLKETFYISKSIKNLKKSIKNLEKF
jgi:cell division septum initiation protein DivIVA